MTKKSPVAVLLLPFVTFGIYAIVWIVKAKGEMAAKGADIPTSWLLIIPFANIWYLWKWSKGVEKVTNKDMGAGRRRCIFAYVVPWANRLHGNTVQIQ